MPSVQIRALEILQKHRVVLPQWRDIHNLVLLLADKPARNGITAREDSSVLLELKRKGMDIEILDFLDNFFSQRTLPKEGTSRMWRIFDLEKSAGELMTALLWEWRERKAPPLRAVL